jgi:hypothetical protein
MQSFLQSKLKVAIYAIVKISLASVMFYFFSQEDILGKKIIFLAFGFLILMSMVPIVVLHQLELKKKKNEQ